MFVHVRMKIYVRAKMYAGRVKNIYICGSVNICE